MDAEQKAMIRERLAWMVKASQAAPLDVAAAHYVNDVAALLQLVDRQTEQLFRFVSAVAEVGMTGDAGIDGAALAAEELLRDLGVL